MKGAQIMQNQNLGIASVPYQTWGDLFTPEEALKIGTIFKELDMPFFAADTTTNNIPTNTNPNLSPEGDREFLLTKINETGFLLDDLTLYLDTHAEDPNALSLFREFSNKRNELKKEFAKSFYPLTRDCILECNGNPNGFCWQDGPVPWEGACI